MCFDFSAKSQLFCNYNDFYLEISITIIPNLSLPNSFTWPSSRFMLLKAFYFLLRGIYESVKAYYRFFNVHRHN